MPKPAGSQLIAGTQSRPWDLGDNVVMTVVLPHKLSKKNVLRLKRYIAALETEASIGWDDDEGGES